MRTQTRRGQKADQANTALWDSKGRQEFCRWMTGTILPKFTEALALSTSFSGDLFGESVMDSFLELVTRESSNLSVTFGYPASGTPDDTLMAIIGSIFTELRYRHPNGRRVTTPMSVYQSNYDLLVGAVGTLNVEVEQ